MLFDSDRCLREVSQKKDEGTMLQFFLLRLLHLSREVNIDRFRFRRK